MYKNQANTVEARNERRDEWAAKSGLKPTPSATACLSKLVGKKCAGWKCQYHPNGNNGLDHVSLWKDAVNGKPDCFVSQPYGLTPDSVAYLNHVSAELGLDWAVNADQSWWFPGWTVLVVLRRAGS